MLPAYQIANEVNETLRTANRLVITAPPGAGKSTVLPLTIMRGLSEDGDNTSRILVLEPRRIAARQIAERMAQTLGEDIGRTVGYRIRFESKICKQTRIEVLTEGILTRMLVEDPTLEGVSTVVFDEFHERNLNSDVALALVREAQMVIRPDLRIVIMSATIDAQSICSTLEAPHIECEGRMFPVVITHTDASNEISATARPAETAERMAHAIRSALSKHEGDILAFFPGEAEIRHAKELLLSYTTPQLKFLPLYGMQTAEEHKAALEPGRDGERKVILATPIAETSLTIEGVRIVIDSGLCRKLVVDQLSGLSRLETVRISQDMATQRSGRAGRVADGICYRLWTKATHDRMPTCRTPEIQEADLASVVLSTTAWGESDILQLPWLTPPPDKSIQQAKTLLISLGAINNDGTITQHGKALCSLPCHPRIANMLSRADSMESLELAADIAAVLESQNGALSPDEASTDINDHIHALHSAQTGKIHRNNLFYIYRAAENYRRIGKSLIKNKENDSKNYISAGKFLAFAYPERVAISVSNSFGTYRLANGDTATLSSSDHLSAYNCIVVASMNTGGGRIFLGAPVEKTELLELTNEYRNLTWDNKQGKLLCQTEMRIGQLTLRQKPLTDITPEETTTVICQAVKKYGTSMLDFNDNVLHLQRRINCVRQWHPELSINDINTDSLLYRAEEWLPLYIGRANTTAELKKIDIASAIWSTLTYEQQQNVERLAPTHINLPNGKRGKIEYRQGAEHPIIRLRLQDCFGLQDTPRVNDGETPVLMELLSPGFKPVQLTQDLRNFWSTTYFDVRKELKRRYPKHAWPENPAEI